MRTTVDLDSDLLERLRVESARRRVSFKQLLNSAIRHGLTARPASAAKGYRTPVHRFGAVREGLNLDKALGIADGLDDVDVATELDRER